MPIVLPFRALGDSSKFLVQLFRLSLKFCIHDLLLKALNPRNYSKYIEFSMAISPPLSEFFKILVIIGLLLRKIFVIQLRF